jgi:hypothetical protein
MARIKIKQPGWEGFTGEIGITTFKDGVSVEHVNRRHIAVIGASLAIVEVDEDGNEGDNPTLQHTMIAETTVRADVLTELPRATDADMAAGTAKAPDEAKVVFHTKEDLERIADKKGINGLREIAAPLGVKGRGINELVKEILKAELKLKAQVQASGALVTEAQAQAATEVKEEAPAGEGEKTPETPAADAPETPPATTEPDASRGDAGPGADETEA